MPINGMISKVWPSKIQKYEDVIPAMKQQICTARGDAFRHSITASTDADSSVKRYGIPLAMSEKYPIAERKIPNSMIGDAIRAVRHPISATDMAKSRYAA